jgi:hypothetical protein
MPCRVDGYEDERSTPLYQTANDATRAACNMRNIIRRHNLENELTTETRKWIMKHDEEDAKRIALDKEVEEKLRKKREALSKLSPEDRRILGL